MANKFKVKIIGILFNPATRRVLVGKNKDDKNLSFLEGDLKHDEELDVGLKRVTKEKTGYIIHNLGAVYARNKLKDREELQIYFLCEVTEGSKRPGNRVAELRWVRPKEVEKMINEKLPSRLKEYIFNLE